MNFMKTMHNLYLFLHSCSIILRRYNNKQARATSQSWPLSLKNM